ncbi:hypothetical protein CARUB_v10002778mg [Capsella rubella]|uniref:Embryo surrounding factor 1 brassicaceae domain-containing protein n=1 Tax=Capsella rubella TaxID=81985 RepID=R0FCR4_9BRAS|nr:hypothetical protein CARUB_v10002778mg [Capsella rubella]
MKSSHTFLICVLMLSLFALYECTRMDVRSNKVWLPCVHRDCKLVPGGSCYCCLSLSARTKLNCWADQHYCNTHCPPFL